MGNNFSANRRFGLKTSAEAAAAPNMKFRMIPIGQIHPNENNAKTYHEGGVEGLKELIREDGIHSPLQVLQIGDTEEYTLKAGHRRLLACQQLLAEGDERFAELPCMVFVTQGDVADEIWRINDNGSVRKPTDGERLNQYEEMVALLNKKKEQKLLKGDMRKHLMDNLGESSGAIARFRQISKATEEVKEMLRDDKCSVEEAYKASGLDPDEQERVVEKWEERARRKKEGKPEEEKKPKAAKRPKLPKLTDEEWAHLIELGEMEKAGRLAVLPWPMRETVYVALADGYVQEGTFTDCTLYRKPGIGREDLDDPADEGKYGVLLWEFDQYGSFEEGIDGEVYATEEEAEAQLQEAVKRCNERAEKQRERHNRR